MAVVESISVLLSVIALIGIWAVWSFGLRPSLVDGFRQKVFEIRDEMFDYAADGNIDFNHPAYGTIRTLMNGYIRFAHRIDTLLIIVVFLFKRKEANRNYQEFLEKLESRMSSLPNSTKEKLSQYLQRAQNELAKHILFTSPLLFPLLFFVAILLLILVLIEKGSRRISVRAKIINQTEKVRLLDAMAFSEAKRSCAA